MLIEFSPSNENAFGIALLAGRVVGTVVGSTGHITVRAVCKAKIDGRWTTTPYDKATHVFLDVPSADGDFADKIGTYYPPNAAKYVGHFYEDRNADPKRVAAARYLLATIAGQNSGTHVLKSERCARCSRELTHPDSITGQFGPECMKHVAPYMQNNSGTDAGAHVPKMRDGLPYGAERNVEPQVSFGKQSTDGPETTKTVEKPEEVVHVDDVLSDLTNAELTTVLDKARDRFHRNPTDGNRRRLDAAVAEFVKPSRGNTGKAAFASDPSFVPPKPNAERKPIVEKPVAKIDEIVAVLSKGDDPKTILATLKAQA